MTDVKKILETIREEDVKYVDLRFTDFRGKWHHLAMDVSCVDEDMFADGVMFEVKIAANGTVVRVERDD